MSEALSAFHFERPLWLLALVPALALWFVARRDGDAMLKWRRVIDPELLPYLLVGEARRGVVTPANALLAAWFLAVVAVAGPAWQREPSPFADAKPAVAVVLKVSASMLTEDLAPTRLDRARQKLADILAQREGAATGLIAYAGSSHLVVPPTPDSAVILDLAKALSPEIMPRQEGDDLAGAIALANRILAGNADGGSILVMADAAGPEAAARLSGSSGTEATILALWPPETASSALDGAARALNATIVATTADQTDVAAIVRRLDRADPAAAVAGDGRHWREAGYWLVPLLTLLALLWFRRGWVLS